MTTGTSYSTDVNNMSLENEVIEVDANANSAEFFAPPLVDDGPHKVIMELAPQNGKDPAIRALRQWSGKGKDRHRTGSPFLDVKVVLRELKDDGSKGGVVCFDNLNSVIMDSAGTSALHAAFDLFGHTLPSRATIGELKSAVESALAQGPIGTVVTRWEASVNKGTQNEPDYQTILKGQTNFPKILDAGGDFHGKYDPEIVDPGTGQKARAQVKRVKYA